MNKKQNKEIIEFIRAQAESETITAVAKRIGTSISYVHHLISGKTTSVSIDKLQSMLVAYPELRAILGIKPDCFQVLDDGSINYQGRIIYDVREKIENCLRHMRQTSSNREIAKETLIGEALLNSIFNREGYTLSKSSIILAIKNSPTIRNALGIDEHFPGQMIICSPHSVQVAEGGVSYNGVQVGESNVTVERVLAELRSQLFPKIIQLPIDDSTKLEILKMLSDEQLISLIKASL